MLFLRSLVYNVVFYVNLTILLVIALTTFLLPRRGILFMAKLWGWTSLWWLRVICGTRVEWRGLEKLPPGGYLMAAKHQSIWETFALIGQLDEFTVIIKRELQLIPVWGWLTIKAGMIPVDRRAGAQAVPRMLAGARQAIKEGRQILIFPEGTRRAPDAPPDYKYGTARLYSATGATCVPVALNSGLFWPRRSFLRYPGTIIVEVLDPIPPGLEPQEFFKRLEHDIETATARLIAEGRANSKATAA